MNFKIQKGFTLLELIIVIAIIAIVAGVALPSYSDFIRRSEVMNAAKSFQSAIDTAKHHARTSGRTITVCGVSDINVDSPTCLTTLGSFNVSGTSDSMGWVVFKDLPDNAGNYDGAATGAHEEVIKRIPFNQRKVRVASNMNNAIIRIAPRSKTGDTGTICVYAPESGSTPITGCSASSAMHTSLKEVKVKLSALGKATIVRY